LTNAGEVLFGNTHPVTLKAGIFATDEKLTFLDMKMYEDNVFNLMQIAEEYIKGNYESEIRNPVIAKMLFLSKSIEQFGSGFKRIDSLCKDSGVEYSYECGSNGFKFILYRPKLISDKINVTYDVTYGEDLNKTERAVLAVLRQNPEISREEIAEKVSKTVRTVQRALVGLVEKGYIKRAGAKKKSTWDVLK